MLIFPTDIYRVANLFMYPSIIHLVVSSSDNSSELLRKKGNISLSGYLDFR